jgi:hypothetical protein
MMTSPGQRPTMGSGGYQPPGRPVLIFYHGDTLKCFNGHAIDAPVIEHGVVRCEKWLAGTNNLRCGLLLYMLGGVGSLREEGGRGVLVTAVTPTEMRALDRSGRSPREVLRFLGLTL